MFELVSLSIFLFFNSLFFALAKYIDFLVGLNFPLAVLIGFLCSSLLYKSIKIEKRILIVFFYFSSTILTMEIGGLLSAIFLPDTFNLNNPALFKSISMILVLIISFSVKKYSILDVNHRMGEIVINVVIIDVSQQL